MGEDSGDESVKTMGERGGDSGGESVKTKRKERGR